MIEVHSQTWMFIATRAREGIEAQQRRLEGPLEQPDTDRARGYIRAMREILALASPVQRPFMTDGNKRDQL